MTVLQEFKNVKLICDLSIGEEVRTEVDGYRTKGKTFVITDIKRSENCRSGVLVKIDGYDNYIDSDWIEKINP